MLVLKSQDLLSKEALCDKRCRVRCVDFSHKNAKNPFDWEYVLVKNHGIFLNSKYVLRENVKYCFFNLKSQICYTDIPISIIKADFSIFWKKPTLCDL